MNPNKNTRRFPAFGRQLDEIRKRGLIPNRRVIVCFDWEIGTLFPRIIIAPDAPVSNLQFRYLAGLHVQIVHYDREASYLPGLIDQLMIAKPASLAIFNMDAVRRGDPAFRMIHRSQSITEAA